MFRIAFVALQKIFTYSQTLIMLLLDGLQGFGGRWTLVCALEVADEHGT
jgi:hypothetical protein